MFDKWEDHFGFFAFIDGMREGYDEFERFAFPERIFDEGHLFLVGGPGGVGKSTFLARCGRLLQSKIDRVYVFDFGQAPFNDGRDFEDMAKQVIRRMADVLESGTHLHEEDVSRLRAVERDPDEAHRLLAQVLKKGESVAVVILPQRIPLSWVHRCHELVRPRMVFLAETGEIDIEKVSRRFGRLPERRTKVIALGPITDKDRDIPRLIEPRLKELSGEEIALVASRLMVPFGSAAEAVAELAHLIESCGVGEITESKLSQYLLESRQRLLERFARTRISEE
ncbi:hypothetical protein [Nonomuraea sp. NPDC050540]|uniref:hypothetical protein n=1 Tax=Nonomuraea sp. NPDC050540 TaxID=3364367 RepID=UPI00378CD916